MFYWLDPLIINGSGDATQFTTWFGTISYVFLFNNDVKDIIDEINKNLKKYLFNFELMNLLKRETIDKYYAKNESLYYLDDKVEHFSNHFDSLDYESQDEYIREEFEKMNFEETAFYYIENIEKNYIVFIKEVDKYINFKKVL